MTTRLNIAGSRWLARFLATDAVCRPFARSADAQNGLWHDVVMTDGPEDPDLSKLTFEVRWPASAARDAKVATKFGILADDSGGAFLLIGHVPPPPWFSPNDRRRGLSEVGSTLEVELGGAFYMTQAALFELYQTLLKHLGKES